MYRRFSSRRSNHIGKRKNQNVVVPALRGDAVALRHCPADAAAFEIPYCGICHLYGALRQRAVFFLSAIIKLQRVTEVPGELHQMPLRPAPGTEALERFVFQIDRKRVLVVSAALAVRAPAEKKLLAALMCFRTQRRSQTVNVRPLEFIRYVRSPSPRSRRLSGCPRHTGTLRPKGNLRRSRLLPFF